MRTLAAHACQGFAERKDPRALRFQAQGKLVRLFARLARDVAREVAGLAAAATRGIQCLPSGLVLGHRGDRLVEPRARFARLLLRVGQRLRQTRLVGLDPDQSRLRGFQPAGQALQLSAQLGHAAVRQVHAALCILALLFGLQQAVAKAACRVVAALLGGREPFDLRAQLLDLGLARERTLLRFAAARHAQPARPEPFAAP